MNESGKKLMEDFPHLRVFGKALFGYVTALGFISVMKDWWKPAEQARTWVFAHPLAAPAMLLGFYAATLLLECVLRGQRRSIEQTRSNPMEPRRRKKVKEARAQRLKNQRS